MEGVELVIIEKVLVVGVELIDHREGDANMLWRWNWFSFRFSFSSSLKAQMRMP